jgi:hypothetical protein
MKIQNYEEFLNEAAKFTSNRSHSDLAMYGLWLRNQIHLFHWQTEIGDQHKALGDFYDSFLGKLDGLVDNHIGSCGDYSVTTWKLTEIINVFDTNVDGYLVEFEIKESFV